MRHRNHNLFPIFLRRRNHNLLSSLPPLMQQAHMPHLARCDTTTRLLPEGAMASELTGWGGNMACKLKGWGGHIACKLKGWAAIWHASSRVVVVMACELSGESL